MAVLQPTAHYSQATCSRALSPAGSGLRVTPPKKPFVVLSLVEMGSHCRAECLSILLPENN